MQKIINLSLNKKTFFLLFGILSLCLWSVFTIFGSRAVYQNTSYLFSVILLLCITAVYIFTYSLLDKKTAFANILIFSILFQLVLIFQHPVSSRDLYSYIQVARVSTEYQANPYLRPYADFRNDEMYDQLENSWSGATTPYGPLFLQISALISKVCGNNLTALIYAYKIFFLILNIGVLILIHLSFRDKRVSYLYAWNPLVIFEFALNAHNDIIYIFFLALAIFFFIRYKNLSGLLSGWVFLTISVFIKYFTLIFLPFYFLGALDAIRDARKKLIFIVSSLASFVILSVIFFAPFWNGIHTFASIFVAQSRVSTFASPLVVFLDDLKFFLHIDVFPGLVGIISFLVTAITFLALLIIYYRKKKSEHSLLASLSICYAIFLICFFSWLMPWYLILLIFLLIIQLARSSHERDVQILIYLVTIWGSSFYLLLR